MSNFECFRSFLLNSLIQVGQCCTKMPNSIRKVLAALLCIFAKSSLSTLPSPDITVSQPKKSDTSGVNAYDRFNLHNDSNQLASNHSISILNQTSIDNASISQAVK